MKLSDIQTGSGGSDFFRLEQGENKLRLVSEFEESYEVFDKELQRSIVLSSKDEEYKGEKPRSRYLCYAIDRADGAIKLLKIGPGIVNSLQELAASDEYAFEDLPPYDITIKKSGQGLNTSYNVVPARQNTELTKEELDALSELDSIVEVAERFAKKFAEVTPPPMDPNPSEDDEQPFEN